MIHYLKNSSGEEKAILFSFSIPCVWIYNCLYFIFLPLNSTVEISFAFFSLSKHLHSSFYHFFFFFSPFLCSHGFLLATLQSSSLFFRSHEHLSLPWKLGELKIKIVRLLLLDRKRVLLQLFLIIELKEQIQIQYSYF